jgi:hypothetical protein
VDVLVTAVGATAVAAAVIDGVAAALAVVTAAGLVAVVATAVAADSGCYGYSCISSSSE